MENSNTTIVQWDGGDETVIHPGTIIMLTVDPSNITPETEAEKI
jgi:hypothetical protein